jgi:hypothetical protein
MIALRAILAIIFIWSMIAFVDSRLHPDSGYIPAAAVEAIIGFLILILYFLARYIRFTYRRRHPLPAQRGFPIKH